MDPGRADPVGRAIQGALGSFNAESSAVAAREQEAAQQTEGVNAISGRRAAVRRRLQASTGAATVGAPRAEAPVVTGAKATLRSVGRLFVADSVPGEAPTVLDLQDTDDGAAEARRLSLRRVWVRSNGGTLTASGVSRAPESPDGMLRRMLQAAASADGDEGNGLIASQQDAAAAPGS